MKDQSLRELVIEVLRANPGREFTSLELAQTIAEANPERAARKGNESAGRLQSKEDIITQYAAEIGAARVRIKATDPQIITTTDRPRKWFYTLDPTPEGRAASANGEPATDPNAQDDSKPRPELIP